MSARLFFGYFFVLAACAILASGSSGTDSLVRSEAADAEQVQPLPSFPTHPRQFAVKHAQVARAE